MDMCKQSVALRSTLLLSHEKMQLQLSGLSLDRGTLSKSMTSLLQPHSFGARLKVSPPEKSELQLQKWQAIIG